MTKKMLIVVAQVLAVAFVLVLMFGCERVQTDDGMVTRLDPNSSVLRLVETGVAVASDVATATSPFLPIMAGVGAVSSTVLGLWLRKIKPQLTRAQSDADMYENVAEATVSAIDELKKTHPDEWAALKEKLRKTVGPETENVIRYVRGLAPKR